MTIEKMAQTLALEYDYYDSVYFDFIVEAVANTKKETGMALAKENAKAYHQYICENFI